MGRNVFFRILATLLAWCLFPCLLTGMEAWASDGNELAAGTSSLGISGIIVYDEEGLEAWALAHKQTGGTVVLGCDISIQYGFYLGSDGGGPILVDTGPYGLVFDGGYISSPGRGENFEIRGEGVDKPVIEVLDMGWSWMGNWNNVLQELYITATGREGVGGTALRIAAVDGSSASLNLLMEEGRIRSYGTGAVGLELLEPTDLYCFRIETSGAGSSAISVPEGARLYYCKLLAQGEEARSVEGNGALLDTCIASPQPEGADCVNRRVLDHSINHLYLPLPLGATPLERDLFGQFVPTFILSGNDSFAEAVRPFGVYWDVDAYESIDTSVLGKTQIVGAVDPVFQGLGLFDDFEPQLTVEVRDPLLPCIDQVDFFSDDRGDYAALFLWGSYDLQRDPIVLWRSDDNGETWQDGTAAEDIAWQKPIWEQDAIYFYYGALSEPVSFQLELVGVGKSNIVTIQIVDGEIYYGTGGDRTGTDRDGQTPGDGPDDDTEDTADNEQDDDVGGEAEDTGGNGQGDKPSDETEGAGGDVQDSEPGGHDDTLTGEATPPAEGTGNTGPTDNGGVAPAGEVPPKGGVPTVYAPDKNWDPGSAAPDHGHDLGSQSGSVSTQADPEEMQVIVAGDLPIVANKEPADSIRGQSPSLIEAANKLSENSSKGQHGQDTNVDAGSDRTHVRAIPTADQHSPYPGFHMGRAILLALGAASVLAGALAWTHMRACRF